MTTPFPVKEFEMYVKAMPQSEAQTALIFLVNFLSQYHEARVSPACQALMERQCEDCE